MYRWRILLLRLWNVFRKQHLEQELNSKRTWTWSPMKTFAGV